MRYDVSLNLPYDKFCIRPIDNIADDINVTQMMVSVILTGYKKKYVEKEGNPISQHFLLFPRCFKSFPNNSRFFPVCRPILLKHCEKKGEIACNEQFLLFPTVFDVYPF